MNPLDQTPSTFDVPSFADDPVLATLIKARQRVDRDWTYTSYVTNSGAVCPIGSIIAVDKGREYGLVVAPYNVSAYLYELSDVAKEAMLLLDAAAIDRHPGAFGYPDLTRHPIEWVNQVWLGCEIGFEDDEDQRDALEQRVKAEVLACYDAAIDNRKEQAA